MYTRDPSTYVHYLENMYHSLGKYDLLKVHSPRDVGNCLFVKTDNQERPNHVRRRDIKSITVKGVAAYIDMTRFQSKNERQRHFFTKER